MTDLTVWQTDVPCPDCGTALTLTDDGGDELRAECRSCNYAVTWTPGQPGAGDQ